MDKRLPVSGVGVILLTLLLAMLADVMPWPDGLSWLRPQWTLLVLVYWTLALPDKVGVFWGLAVGLFLDVLLNTPFGVHALTLVLCCYLTQLAQKRLERLDALLQSLVVFLLVGVALWVTYILQDAMGEALLPPYVVLCLTFASALVWLPLSGLLRYLRHIFLVR